MLWGAWITLTRLPAAQGNMIRGFTIQSGPNKLSAGANNIRASACTAVLIYIEVAPTSMTTFKPKTEYHPWQDPQPYVYPVVSSEAPSVGRQRAGHTIMSRQAVQNGALNYANLPYGHSSLWVSRTGSPFDSWNPALGHYDFRSIKPSDFGVGDDHYFDYGDIFLWEDVQKGVKDYKLWVEMYDVDRDALASVYNLSATISVKE